MTSTKIVAPWTAAQVDALNRFQRAGFVHPFTCWGHDDGGDRELVATRAGWICCHCDYRQIWAHAFMLEEPVNPLAAKTGWQPIETAPRDAEILVSNGVAVGEARFHDPDGWYWANTDPTDTHDGYVWNVSHWQPLPAPPKKETA